MKIVLEHIDRLKEKPHHIRKQIAFGAAAAGTALVAVVWLAVSIGTGAFALKDTSFASSAGEDVNTTGFVNNNEQLAGAGAASLIKDDVQTPARIEIVESVSTATSMKKAEQTVIPF
ncbi:MAG: hypothetical protein Q8L30_01510 [bacterium]|nr:hypothetical protein [bacterium]